MAGTMASQQNIAKTITLLQTTCMITSYEQNINCLTYPVHFQVE